MRSLPHFKRGLIEIVNTRYLKYTGNYSSDAICIDSTINLLSQTNSTNRCEKTYFFYRIKTVLRLSCAIGFAVDHVVASEHRSSVVKKGWSFTRAC